MPGAEARSKTVLLALCCVAQFMVILDVAIVNVALPAMRVDLDFSVIELQWVVNAYSLTFGGFLLLGGRVADILGRREMFVAGLALFGLASLAGGLAESKGLLIGARAAQGIGSAIVVPVTLSVLTTAFPEGRERNHALGLWTAMGAVGGTSGAIVGGVLTEALSWRWILLVNVPIALAAVLAALRTVPSGERDRRQRRDFDLTGALTVTAGLAALNYAIVSIEQHSWESVHTLGVGAVAVVLLAAFVVVEARFARMPLVPLEIFASRALTGANVVVVCMGGAMFAMWYFITLYLQQVLGYSPIEAGLAMMPMNLIIVVCAQLASRLTNRIGAERTLAIGMGLVAAGMLAFTRISADGTFFEHVLVPSLLASSGLGFAFVAVTILGTGGVPAPQAGLASGLVNTSRTIGASVGLALLATVAARRTAGAVGLPDAVALTEGFQSAFAGAAIIAAIGIVACLALLVHRRPAPAAASEPA